MTPFTQVPRATAEAIVCRCWMLCKLKAGQFWMAEGDHLEDVPAEAEGVWVFNECNGKVTTVAYKYDPDMKRKKRRRTAKVVEGQLSLF